MKLGSFKMLSMMYFQDLYLINNYKTRLQSKVKIIKHLEIVLESL